MQIDFLQNLKGKTIVIGGDHHSREVVAIIHDHLAGRGLKVELLQYDDNSNDYIHQARGVAEKVQSDPDKYCGIVGCKNGFGVTTVCNKYRDVFAARCDTCGQAIDARKVNYSNVMTFGASFVTEDGIKQIVDNWLDTDFDVDEKNTGRLERLFEIGKRQKEL